MQSSALEKKKAVKMIVVGFAGPFVLIFAGLILSAALSFVQKTVGGDVGIIKLVSNIVLLLVGLIGVIGLFSWGPIIGVIGIIKLSKAKEAQAETNQIDLSGNNTNSTKINK